MKRLLLEPFLWFQQEPYKPPCVADATMTHEIKRTYRYRLYPNQAQRYELAYTFGCSRGVQLGACGAHHDRDMNAAKNLSRVGQTRTEAIASKAPGDLGTPDAFAVVGSGR